MVKKILNLFGKEISGLHEAAYLLGFFTILSQLLALVRDRLLAHHFGAGSLLDLYYASFRIPDFIFVTIASVVSISVLVPFLIDKIEKDQAEARYFINNIFSFFFFFVILATGIVFIFVPQLLKAIYPGFAGAQSHELVTMTRILLLSPILLGFSNFLASITQVHKQFLVYAISPLLYNSGVIIGIVVFILCLA